MFLYAFSLCNNTKTFFTSYFVPFLNSLSYFYTMKLFYTALLLFSITVTAWTQVNSDSVFIKKIFDQTLVDGKAYDNLRILCKQVGHRLSGSNAMYKAEEWGLKTLTEYNADKVYLQECMVPHWVRGAKEEGVYKWTSTQAGNLQVAEKNTEILALGNSVGTNGETIKAPLIMIKNFDELEAQKDNIKGKIVFYSYHFDQTYIRTFNGYRDAVPYRSGGASRAAKYGAVGVIVRTVGTAPDNNPHTGALRYNDSFPKIPAVAMGIKDADNLAQLYKNGKVTFSLKTNVQMLPDTLGHNVIAEIKGSEFPNQIITIGGHLDSWDVGEGAHDDGAGCVQSMELINIFKKLGYQPKHTIRVVLFANEENGLKGGTKYAEEAEKNKEEHIAAIESDAGGFSPRSFGGTMTDVQYSKFNSWLPLLLPYGINELGRSGGGSDIGPLGTKFKTPTIGLNPDSQRYFDLHHARTDVFEAVNKRELHLGAASMAALVYLIDKYGL
jgi:carboxypeptidase Q